MNFTLNITASQELLDTLNRIAEVMKSFLDSPSKNIIVEMITDNSNISEKQSQVISDESVKQNGQTIPYPAQNSTVHTVQVAMPNLQNTQSQPAVNTAKVYTQTLPLEAPINAALPQQTISTPQVVPTSSQTFTMEQLAMAATEIVDAGRRAELVALLNSFGVQALTALPKEQYGAFAAKLMALGEKINNLFVLKRNTQGTKIDNLCVQKRNTQVVEIENTSMQKRNAEGEKIDNLFVPKRNTEGVKIDNLYVQKGNTEGPKI